MRFIRKLPIPMEIKKQFPLKAEWVETRNRKLTELRDIFEGKSGKFVLIIGPCSADNRDAVMRYLEKLCRAQEETQDRLLIIPRIYTNKPRTTGEGYKGMLHQPDPAARPDMLKGIIAIRELHRSALSDYGLPVPMKCSIPKTTVICPIFWPILP